MNGRAGAIFHREQKHRGGYDLHLLVVARGLERVAPSQQRGIERGCILDGGTVNGFSYAVQIGVRSIEQNHSPLREQARIEARVSRAQSLSGTIGLTQNASYVGFSQQSC